MLCRVFLVLIGRSKGHEEFNFNIELIFLKLSLDLFAFKNERKVSTKVINKLG